jgi:hypothetical protein
MATTALSRGGIGSSSTGSVPVRASGQLQADGWARWRRLVDGLAAEGYSGAAGFQRAEE